MDAEVKWRKMIETLFNAYYALRSKWVNWWARHDRALELSRRPYIMKTCFKCNGKGTVKEIEAWGVEYDEPCGRCKGLGLE